MFESIITTRFAECWPSFYFVHEWEDVFQRLLKLPFLKFDHDIMQHRSGNIAGNDIAILPMARQMSYYTPHNKLIPIVVDCWKDDIPFFVQQYADVPVSFVASLEAYSDILAAGFNRQLFYLPMSVSDSIRQASVPDKHIDVIQYGRTNGVLNEYMLKFCNRFPRTNYVTMEIVDGRIHYNSTTLGHLGEIHDRERFIKLLAASRVSLVSSPGIDGSKATGGYNPVAVRFFESAAQFCYMLGRYPDNQDFRVCDVASVCPSINSYDEFEERLMGMLSKPFNQYEQFNHFLDKHVTSQRVMSVLARLGIDGLSCQEWVLDK